MATNKLKMLLSVILALVMALMLGTAAVADTGEAVLSVQERTVGQKIDYIGGVVLRTGTRAEGSSLLEIACVLANDPYVILGQPSLWEVRIQGGTAPYTVKAGMCYRSFDDADQSNSWPIVDEFPISDLIFEHTFTEAGRYFWEFTVTDADGQSLIFQTRIFETYTEVDEADATTVAGKVNSIVSQLISDGMSDYRRALVLHDWLINNAEYDLTYTHYDAAGVLLYGTGVCDSYARAYQMLLSAAGVESMIVTGTAGSDDKGWENHGWNLVLLDGQWYHVDCTWDDPTNSDECHDYFCLTDEEIAVDHIWNRPGSSVDNGMLVPDANGGVYSDVEATTDYDFAFSDIASFEAGMDAQVEAMAYTPVIAIYTQGVLADIEDELMASLNTKLQEYANRGLLGGDVGIAMTGSTLELTLPWTTEASYIRINETEFLLSAGETATLVPALISPADAEISWSVDNADVLSVSGTSGAFITAHAEGTAILTATMPSGLTDTVTVRVLPASEADFGVQMTAQADGTTTFTWNAVPGATQYALIAAGETDTQVAATEACTLTVATADISSKVCSSLKIVARRILNGETALTYTSEQLTPPEPALEIDLNLIQHFDTVFTGGTYQPVVFRLEIANYDELAAKYGSLMTEFYIDSSADESLGSYGYLFSDARGAHAQLMTQPTATGSLTLTATAVFGDLRKSVEIPITVTDPSELTVSFPSRIDATAGEDFSYVITFNGEPCPWLASDSMYFDYDLITEPGSQSPAAYAFTAVAPGISPLHIDVYYSNLPVKAHSVVFIADSEGNVPELKPELSVRNLCSDFYLNGAYAEKGLCTVSVSNANFFRDVAPDVTPAWTVSSDSETPFWSLTQSNYNASLNVYPMEIPQTGAYTLTLSCTIGEEGDPFYCTNSVDIPVTMSDCPITDETALLPSTITTQVGDTFILNAASALPADWSGSTPTLIMETCGDAFQLLNEGGGNYSCTPLQPGVYSAVFCWQLNNLVYYPTVSITVADENGNLPVSELSTWANLQCDKLFTNGNPGTYMICAGIGNLQEFTDAYGVDHVNFALTNNSDESLGTYELDSITKNSAYIVNSVLPTAAGTANLTLTISVGEEGDAFYQSTDMVFPIDIAVFDPALFSVTLPQRVDGQVGQQVILTPTVVCPENESWTIHGASLEKGEILGFAGSTSDQLSYRFDALASGISTAGVTIGFRNATVAASTMVYIADEEGNLPSLDMELVATSDFNPLYVRDTTHHCFAYIELRNLDKLKELTGWNTDPDWTVTIPEGAPNITYRANGDFLSLYVEDDLTTPGSWDVVVDASLGYEGATYYTSGTVTVTLFVEPDPRTETSLIPSRIDLQAGETFTINKLGRLPADWNGPRIVSFQQLSCTDGIELVSQTDTEATFRVLTPGLWNLDLFWQLNNLTDRFRIDVFAADENGEVPGTGIEMATNIPLSDFHFIGGSDAIGFFRIDNYDAMSTLYEGEPQWSVTVLDGPELATNDDGRYFSLTLAETPTDAWCIDFRVDCVWGDASWSEQFYLEIVEPPAPIPTTLNVQDVYYLSQGESLLLDPTQLVLPEDFDASAGRAYANIGYEPDGPLGDARSCYTVTHEENDCVRLTAYAQGIRRITVYWEYQNLSVRKDVLLFSADENGEFLSITPELFHVSRCDFLLANGNFHTFGAGSVKVQNEGELTELLGSDLQLDWNITVSEGGPDVTVEKRGSEVEALVLGSSLKAGEYDLTFTCTAQDPLLAPYCTASFTTPLVVRDNPVSDKDYAGIPATINAQVGVPFSFNKLTAMDSAWDGPAPQMFISSGGENFTLVESTDSVVTYQPIASGIYTVDVDWQLVNMLACRTVTIRVADENGNLPMPEMDMNVMYDNDIIYIIGYDGGNINSHRIDNYDALREVLAGEPVWTVTALENCTDDQLSIEVMYEGTTATWLNPYPTEPCTVRYKVTCTWDGAVWEGESAMTFVKVDSLPTAIDVPDQIILSPGESYTFYPTDILPAGWSDDRFSPEAVIVPGYFNSDYWDCFNTMHQNKAVTLTGNCPGVYPMLFRWCLPNYDIEKEVQVVIRNEDGSLPFPTFGIETMGTWCDFYADGNTLDLFEMSVYDYFDKYHLFSDDITWKVEQTSGPAKVGASGFFVAHDPEVYPPTVYSVKLNSWPTVEGVYTYRVTAKWGQCVQNVDLTVNVLPALLDTPIEGIAVEDVTIKVGETIAIPMEPIPLLPEGADLPIDGASNQFAMSSGFVTAFTHTGDENGSWIYQANEVGVYEYYLRRWGGNFNFEKTITVTVTDENGEMPMPDLQLKASPNAPLYAGGNSLALAYIDPVDSSILEQFDSRTNEEPIWTLEKLSGTTDAVLEFYTGSRCPGVVFTEAPAEGDYSFRITLEWAGTTIALETSVTVLPAPASLPTGIALPDTITMVVGEDYTVSTADAILPQGWTLDNLTPFYMIFDDNSNLGHMTQIHTGKADTLTFRFDKTDVYHCTWYAQCANFFLRKPVTIYVTEADGSITSDRLTMMANTSDTIYAGGNDLFACSTYMYNGEAEDFAATTTEKPQWSYDVISGDYDFVLVDGGDNYFCSLEFAEPPAEGTAVVRITMRWADEILSVPVTVVVKPGPDSPPTGLIFPDEVTVKVNEVFKVTYDNPFLPEGWGIEGQEFFANLWEAAGSSGHMTRVDTTEAFTFAYIFDEPGVYSCTWFARCGNYTKLKPVTVKVTDENGNMPSIVDLISNALPRMYLESINRLIGNIYFSSDSYDSLQAIYGGEPTYELVESSHPINCRSFGGGDCALFLNPMPEEPCTVTFTVRVTWGDLVEIITGSTEVLHLANGLPTLDNAPDYIRVKPGESYTLRLEELLTPSDWSSGYDDGFEFFLSASGDTWDYVDSSTVSPTERTVSSRYPGAYQFSINYRCANVSAFKDIYLLVEDSDGTLWIPENAFTLQPRDVTWYKGGNNPFLLEAIIEPDIYDLWMKLYPEGPQWFDNVIATPTGVPGHFAISLKDTDIEVGEYSLEIGFNWGNCGTAVEGWLVVEDPGVTLPEKLRLADTFELTTGQGFAIVHDALLPEGWNIGGDTGSFDVVIFNEEAGILERDTSVDGVTSFQAVAAGTCKGQIHWFCENFYIIQDFTVVVSEAKLNVTAQQAEYTLVPGMCVQTAMTGDTALITGVQWRTADASVAEVDKDGAITALGTGTTTVTASLTGENGAACEVVYTVNVISDARQMILPAALTTIESEAFLGTGAQVIIVPKGVTSIGSSAFAASDSLVLVRIPASVTRIGSGILTGTDAAILCEAGTEAETYALANGIPCYIIK